MQNRIIGLKISIMGLTLNIAGLMKLYSIRLLYNTVILWYCGQANMRAEIPYILLV